LGKDFSEEREDKREEEGWRRTPLERIELGRGWRWERGHDRAAVGES
jgi:hypothetical protein